MMNKEDRIKQIAYGLWEREGRPNGKAVEHYYRAERIWNEENRQDGKTAASIIAPAATKAAATPPSSRATPRKKTSKK